MTAKRSTCQSILNRKINANRNLKEKTIEQRNLTYLPRTEKIWQQKTIKLQIKISNLTEKTFVCNKKRLKNEIWHKQLKSYTWQKDDRNLREKAIQKRNLTTINITIE